MTFAFDEFDLIVIGAGISGLSLAHRAAQDGRRVLVVERDREVGGCIQTARCDLDDPTDVSEPFWLELGPHTCYNSYAQLISLLEHIGSTRVLARQKLSFKLLVKGAPRSIPSQLSPAELLLSAPRLPFTPRRGQTIRSYYCKLVGPKNYRQVFEPLFNAVACQDTSDFGVEYLFKKRPGRRKDYLRSFTFPGGLATLANGLAAHPGVSISVGIGAAAIAISPAAAQVQLEDGSTLMARTLALATGPAQAASLVERSLPELAGLLRQVPVSPLYSLGVAVEASQLRLPLLAGMVSAGEDFYSIVSRDVVPHPTLRGFTFHCKQDDPDRNLRLAEQVLGVDRGRFKLVVHRQHQLPRLRADHADLVRELDRVVADMPLTLTGNFFLGLSLEDCVGRSFAQWDKLSRF